MASLISTIPMIATIPMTPKTPGLQTSDGAYKLVGVVNWGGGKCGEVCFFLTFVLISNHFNLISTQMLSVFN